MTPERNAEIRKRAEDMTAVSDGRMSSLDAVTAFASHARLDVTDLLDALDAAEREIDFLRKRVRLYDDYKRGYSKGYVAGSRHGWPAHKPPTPPDAIAAAIHIAARELRDECDSFCATIEETDEIALKLGPKIDALDAAFMRLSEFLRSANG